MIQSVVPESKEAWLAMRAKNINSTDVAALFGLSPYLTEFELWHRHRGGPVAPFQENERMKWGTRLQDAIAAGIAEDHGWSIRAMSEYIHDTDLRMGSSFDFAIGDDGIMEIKNVDAIQFAKSWLIDGDDIQAPPHIELQVQHQLALTGRKFTKLCALVGGNEGVIVHREPSEKIVKSIKYRIKKFWDSIEAGIAPQPDFVKDSEFIAQLNSFANPGAVVDVAGQDDLTQMAADYRDLGERVKACEDQRSAIKAQFLMKLGDTEKMRGDNWSISAGIIGEAEVAYTRKAYRGFKLTWRKPKGE